MNEPKSGRSHSSCWTPTGMRSSLLFSAGGLATYAEELATRILEGSS